MKSWEQTPKTVVESREIETPRTQVENRETETPKTRCFAGKGGTLRIERLVTPSSALKRLPSIEPHSVCPVKLDPVQPDSVNAFCQLHGYAHAAFVADELCRCPDGILEYMFLPFKFIILWFSRVQQFSRGRA